MRVTCVNILMKQLINLFKNISVKFTGYILYKKKDL